MLQRPKFISAAAVLTAGALAFSGCTNSEQPADEGSGAAEGRTVEGQLGPVTVPENVESVVVLEGRRDLDIALSLGLPLVGFPYQEEGTHDLDAPFAEELAEAEDNGAEPLFLREEPNVEAIAAADPDLIISRVDDVEPLRDEPEAVAPVLAIGDQNVSTWQEDLKLVAEATGREDEAEQIIADYEAEVASLREEFAEVLDQHTFAPMGYNSEEINVAPNRLLSTVLRDLEATPSEAFADAIEKDDGTQSYSREQIVDAFGDADALIAIINDKETWDEANDNDLFNQLPSVEEGHVVRSDRQTHEGAALTAKHCLELIRELLETFEDA